MQLKMYFPGYFCVKMEGGSVQKALSISSFRKLLLWDIQESHTQEANDPACDTFSCNKFTCKIRKQQYGELASICQKTDVTLSVQSEHGFCRIVETAKRTCFFWLGLLLCLFLLFFYQTRIWDIQVVGNIYYDSPIILSFLESKKIISGMNKNTISFIELGDEIRQAFPKIKWTSVELNGTNLIIHIKENLHPGANADSADRSNSSIAVSSDLVAEKDGIIKSIYVRSGIANVKAGDTCKKGDILVKGQIPIYNDNQELVRYESVDADADIILQYEYAYYDSIERNIIERISTKRTQKHTMQIANYHIKPAPILKNTFPNTKEAYSEQLVESKQLKITPTFPLPVYISTITTYEYEEKPKILTKKETEEQLQQEFSYFCEDLEKKGVQIYQNNVKMYISDATGTACGKIIILEKCGVSRTHGSEQTREDPVIDPERLE